MSTRNFPTKGNLILARNSLIFLRQGYNLLDKKRNVLIHEIMELSKSANKIQQSISKFFSQAYLSLQVANIQNGISNIQRLIHGVTLEENLKIKTRSIMGVEIPIIIYHNSTRYPSYGFANTFSSLDKTLNDFNKIKDLIIKLTEIENSAYRISTSIKQTQKRANALKNITIPKFEKLVKTIRESLEERERDEFTRLKMIKKIKNK
ncbi:MAG: V-type ATP synthase subunit D [Clostridiales bacterium]|nr:V-type ATP synthase subunit D [Clostridiales bacterium]